MLSAAQTTRKPKESSGLSGVARTVECRKVRPLKATDTQGLQHHRSKAAPWRSWAVQRTQRGQPRPKPKLASNGDRSRTHRSRK